MGILALSACRNLSLTKLLLLVLIVLAAPSARAVLVNDTTYQTSEPTNSDIANWSSGWGASGLTGWDYVGTVNGSSAVYLGNGWVITAAHVGVGSFTLDGTSYAVLTNTTVTFGTADLVMFQLSSAPDLPTLALTSTAPISLSTQVVMIGYGDGNSGTTVKTWGADTVTSTSSTTQVTVGSTIYSTTDFIAAYGTHTYRSGRNTVTITNTAEAVTNDSGGAAFVYSGSAWQLAGLMEAVGSDGTTYFIQLSSYSSAISTAMLTSATIPEPSPIALLGLLLPAWMIYRKSRRANPHFTRSSAPGFPSPETP